MIMVSQNRLAPNLFAYLGWGARKKFARFARVKILSVPPHSKYCRRPDGYRNAFASKTQSFNDSVTDHLADQVEHQALRGDPPPPLP